MKNLFISLLVILAQYIVLADTLSNDDFLYKKALKYKQDNKIDFAVDILKKLYSESPDLKHESYKELLSIYDSQKKWTESGLLIKNELKTQPFNTDLRNDLIDIYKKQNDQQSIIDEITVIEKIKGTNTRLLTDKYKTYFLLNDYANALESINQILLREPQNYTVNYDKAYSLFELKKYKDSYSQVRKIYSDGYINSDVLALYAQASFKIDYLGEFTQVAKKCLSLFPKNLICNEYLGQYHFVKGNYKQALTYFKTSFEQDNTKNNTVIALAQTAEKLGFNADVNFYYEKCLANEVQNSQCLKEWVSSIKHQNNNSLLAQVLENFIKKNNNHSWATIEYAKLLHHINENQLAINYVRKLTLIYPENDDIKLYLTFFLFKNNLIDEAKNTLLQIKNPHIDKDYYTHLIEPTGTENDQQKRSLSSIPINFEFSKNNSWELPEL